ncbi:MAG: P-loop ATPase, Sll1717 family [Candidatus Hodarchaeales archaeon]
MSRHDVESNSRPSCFVAYPSKPSSLIETIEKAIKLIADGQLVDIQSWKKTSVSGKFIITSICEAIDKNDILICDLTYLNHNVLFELGYAIARNKRVWIIRDFNTDASNANYESFKTLTTVGYVSYSNSQNIHQAFYDEKPYEDIEDTIYKRTIESITNTNANETVLYLKSRIQTEACITLTRLINQSCPSLIVDDPEEVRTQTLPWYAEKIWNSHSVIAHFLSQTHSGSELQNAKSSFVCGLAYGLGKKLLMLAHEPYVTPIDYTDILKTHDTAVRCGHIAAEWLKEVNSQEKVKTTTTINLQKRLKAQSELQRISIGESVAEYEEENLIDYFVNTVAYKEALKAKHSLFVGRKGSGKTAILYKLSDDIKFDKRNHLCLIKPVGYEVSGIVEIVEKTLQSSEKGYLIQSLWKYLILTELAKSIYQLLKEQPLHYQPSKEEEDILRFVDENSNVIIPDFSIRLEQAVIRLQKLGQPQTSTEKRVKISELLHDEIIGKLRILLTRVLREKHKVVILIDNLDKTWNPWQDIIILCDLLFGLIEVNQTIVNDFQKSNSMTESVNLSIVTFLRSDIFEQVLNNVIERDKLTFSRISWDDNALLLRVIEERFMASTNITDPELVWAKYFCPFVDDMPLKQFLSESILPQPRDLIYLLKASLSYAINRRHSVIEEEDIIDAQSNYSKYALDSLDAENAIQFPNLTELLYEFVGTNEITDQSFIIESLNKCGVPEHRLQEAIELLCDLAFLGREVEVNQFEFQHSEQEKNKLQIMARRLSESSQSKTPRFKINRPFHSYLEIKHN